MHHASFSFCPALAVISKKLKMSENLAGVTLLAFGNGSPDIFASLANFSGDTELMYSELMGAALFVTGFIAGLIIFLRPMKIISSNYVRDVMFFSFALFIINQCMTDLRYHLVEGVCTVLIYLAYLAVVIANHLRVKREVKKLRKLSTVHSVRSSAADFLKKADDLEAIAEIQIKSRKDSSVILDEDILRRFRLEFFKSANERLLKTFVQDVNPVDVQEWKEAKWIAKIFMIVKVSGRR